MRPTWAEISLDSFESNLGEARKLAGENTLVMAVVKADAYGHGAVRISEAALRRGADMLGVATVAEAMELREAGIKSEILLLGGVDPGEASAAVENSLTPACYSLRALGALSEAAVRAGKEARYHLKVDTGMTRLGVGAGEIESFLAAAAELPGTSLRGVFTHFASAEREDGEYTRRQMKVFREALSSLDALGVKYGLAHAANSAALQRFSDSRMDMARPGIMLYGSGGLGETALLPVMKFKTRIAQTRKAPAGTAVSYGGTFVAKRDSLIATLPVGYADGYPRKLSNRAKVSVRGGLAPVAGTVCMDFVMVDVTDVPGVGAGDEVTLFGDGAVSVEDVSLWAETIPYEILSMISPRVPRVYV